jgi:hypothetical protein
MKEILYPVSGTARFGLSYAPFVPDVGVAYATTNRLAGSGSCSEDGGGLTCQH